MINKAATAQHVDADSFHIRTRTRTEEFCQKEASCYDIPMKYAITKQASFNLNEFDISGAARLSGSKTSYEPLETIIFSAAHRRTSKRRSLVYC